MSVVRKTKLPKRQLVWVEFIDHADASGWEKTSDTTLDRAKETVHAVGWVVKENKEILQLTSWHVPHRSEGEFDSNLRSYIVKGAITKRRRLKESR